MSNKTIISILIIVVTLLIGSLIFFYWPEKLTVREQCLKDGITKECENMEIWECHEYHCHKICNETNNENCANKECILSNERNQDKHYCMGHLH